jgi:CheY-like chemotaxis protein
MNPVLSARPRGGFMMSALPPTSPGPRRLLLLAKSAETIGPWLELLRGAGEVEVVTDAPAALQALQSQDFAYVIVPGSELLPLGAVAGREQARGILDALAQGVLVIDRAGQRLWLNQTLNTYPPEVVEALRAALAETIPTFVADPRHTQSRTLALGSRHFELHASALLDPGDRLDRVIGVITDTTAVTRTREKLEAIDAAGRELVALEGDANARLEVPERLNLLEDKLIKYCRELLDFNHFAVLVLDPQTNRLDTVLTGGIPEHSRVASLQVAPEGNGISGYVAATGQSYVCPDVTRDALYLSGFEGARSSLTVPLRLNERIVGVLNVESDEPAAFNDEDRQVAEIFGRYIAVALQTLRLLVVERSETTGQLAADVRAILAEPLDRIVVEATQLLQQDPGVEERTRRLRAIIQLVDQAKQETREVTQPQAIRGLIPDAPAKLGKLHNKRVLVADDEDIIRETIADVLSKVGALPITAGDGAEAVAMLRTQQFDLVLSDIKMPLKNGYEVFAAAKEMNTGCPVILITGFGYDPEHSIVRASREGLAGVLFKPFKVEQLMELIDKALTPS